MNGTVGEEAYLVHELLHILPERVVFAKWGSGRGNVKIKLRLSGGRYVVG